MNAMRSLLCRAAMASLLVVAAVCCRHKELCYDHSYLVEIEVNFDWSKCPDATPRTMVLQLFAPDGRHYNRYEFGSPQGGVIRVHAGTYKMLFHNGDMDNVVERGSTYDAYEVTTIDRALLAPIGRGTEAPRPSGAQGQPVRYAPEMIWAGRCGLTEVRSGQQRQSVTLVPEEATVVYTVEILNVENLGATAGIGGAFTGLAESYSPARGAGAGSSVTVPLDLKRVDERTLTTRFVAFGHCPVGPEQHTFSVYTTSKWFYHFDVTEQLHGASDPRNVRVVIDGLKLPDEPSGGMDTSVSDWNDNVIETDVNMH
ncbi:DUF5119 domain-containing protein [Alistipes sp.]|uniref:DUF5119 domain-containing protein n=1 Tax=Alistipes sp. TaxID=1872444 RepID=UPI003A86CCBC